MNQKELYQQKVQAQLDDLKAEIETLKARVSGTEVDAHSAINKEIAVLEHGLEDAHVKLTELAKAGEDAWESCKNGMESAWDSLKSAVSDAAVKLKG